MMTGLRHFRFDEPVCGLRHGESARKTPCYWGGHDFDIFSV